MIIHKEGNFIFFNNTESFQWRILGEGKCHISNIRDKNISFIFVIPSAKQTVNNIQKGLINPSFSPSFEPQILV